MFVAPLTQENPDLFKWLTGQTAPPEEVSANAAFTVGQWEILIHLLMQHCV